MSWQKFFWDKKKRLEATTRLGTDLLTRKQPDILSAAVTLMIAVVASRLLGLVRDRLLVTHFTPDLVDVYLAAFQLPDTLFSLMVSGVLSAAFIPVFTEVASHHGQEKAWHFASVILNWSVGFFLLVTFLAFIFIDPLSRIIAPGLLEDHFALMKNLTRIMLLGQIFLLISSLFIGIAQSFQRFLIPAMAGILYNLGIILGIVFFTQEVGIYSAAAGVLLGAFLHLLVQIPLVFSLGFTWRPTFSVHAHGVKTLFHLMLPRTAGLAVEQISEVVAVQLASLIAAGSITFLRLAQHLYFVPIGLFGATIAQAALPILSQQRLQGSTEEFKKTIGIAFHHIVFLVLPFTACLVVLRVPLVRLVFGGSAKFDWTSTQQTSLVLAVLSVGLVAAAVNQLLIRGYYALKDTKTPVIISIVSVSVTILCALAAVLVWKLPVWSLGLSSAVGSWVQVVLLALLLHRAVGWLEFRQVVLPLWKMVAATLVMTVILLVSVEFLLSITRTIYLLFFTVLIGLVGFVVYVGTSWILKVEQVFLLVKLVERFRSMRFVPPRTPEITMEPEQS